MSKLHVPGGQRGEGKLGGIMALAVLAAFGYALVNAAPAYVADYNLADKMHEIARLGRGMNPDEKILERLMGAVKDYELDEYVAPGNFTINTRDSSRRIQVEYERMVKFLPGFERKVTFSHDVDQPFF